MRSCSWFVFITHFYTYPFSFFGCCCGLENFSANGMPSQWHQWFTDQALHVVQNKVSVFDQHVACMCNTELPL